MSPMPCFESDSSAIVKLCLLTVVMLLGASALRASDEITLTLDKNYYNPHALSLKYLLCVPPVPPGRQYRLLLWRVDPKRNRRTDVADIELPPRREHELYFFIEKDHIRTDKKGRGTPATVVPCAKISLHLREQTRVESSLQVCRGYIRYANAYRGKIDLPIRVLEIFHKTGPIPMQGKNVMDFNFGDPVDFDPIDLSLEIRAVDIPKKRPPRGDADIDLERMKQMDLAELMKYRQAMEKKYLAGEIGIEDLNSIQTRINELQRRSR